MIPFLRPPFRSNGGATVPTLSSAVVTVLGLRVTRAQILRVSGLLALRSISGMIDIPLDDSVQAYLWTFLFSSAQAGVALATAASFFDFGGVGGQYGIFSRLFSRIFPSLSSSDGPFLTLYASVVLIIGPLIACLESAIMIYEIMAIARRAEQAMYTAEENGSRIARPLVLASGFASLLGVGAIGLLCTRMVQHLDFGAIPIIIVTIILLVSAGVMSDANVVEASFIALYVAVLWIMALTEEILLGAPLFQRLRYNTKLFQWANGDDVRAILLVTSLLFLLITMSRLEHFVRVMALGHDQLEQIELESEGENADNMSDLQKDSEEEEENKEVSNRRTSQRVQRDSTNTFRNKPKLKPVISTVTLLAATFRILLWAGQVNKGEYVPLALRGWQMLICVVLYVLYARI